MEVTVVLICMTVTAMRFCWNSRRVLSRPALLASLMKNPVIQLRVEGKYGIYIHVLTGCDFVRNPHAFVPPSIRRVVVTKESSHLQSPMSDPSNEIHLHMTFTNGKGATARAIVRLNTCVTHMCSACGPTPCERGGGGQGLFCHWISNFIIFF